MKHLATLLILFPTLAYSQNPKQDEHSFVTADINCDGKQDLAKITYQQSKLTLSVQLGTSGEEHSLIFGRGSGSEQDSLCGSTISLSKEAPENSNEDTGLDTLLEGHIIQQGCFDLKLNDEECDSIHVYWNHSTNQLNWWRL